MFQFPLNPIAGDIYAPIPGVSYKWDGFGWVPMTSGLLESYQRLDQKGNADGYAGLDSAGVVPTSQLPALATAAEALAGILGTVALAPLSLAANSSPSATGYYRFPGGITFQWRAGLTTNSNGDGSWTFPLTFARGVYVVLATDRSGDRAITVTTGNISNGFCNFYTNSSTTGLGIGSVVDLLAIGRV